MKHWLSIVFAVLIASGCASYAPSKDLIGQSRATLVAQMGEPEREYEQQGLKKLHFPRGPAGSHTYFVYLDNSDRVVNWEQVLTEERFGTIRPGMSRNEVIDILGISKITNGLARHRGYVWHYRYATPHCQSFVIEFTAEDVVRSAGYRVRSGRRCKYVGQG
jgi:hypothetical protein